MSTPGKVKLTIYQGSTFRKTVTWKVWPYPIEVRNGVAYQASTGSVAPQADLVPVDLTGCTARMHIRAKLADATTLMELTTENGGITIGGTTGEIVLFVSDEDSSAEDWKSGVYDLEIVHPSGDVTRLIEGSISLVKEVTRG